MNLCFLIGKIISDIEFKFIINNKKYIAISIFTLKVSENCIIKVKAYNELADECYQKLVKSDVIGIQGKLNSNMEVIIEVLEKMRKSEKK